MKILKVYSPFKRDFIKAYTDLIVKDRHNNIFLVSFSGKQSNVNEIESGINRNTRLILGTSTGRYSSDGMMQATRDCILMPRGKYKTISSNIDDLKHNIMYMDFSENDNIRKSFGIEHAIFSWNGEIVETLYSHLDSNFDIPLLPEWSTWIYNSFINRNYSKELIVESFGKETKLKGLSLNITKSNFEALISEGIRNKEISFQDTEEKDENLNYINNLSSYLKAYSNLLGQKISENFTPLHDPRNNKLSEKIRELKKHPFRAQADLIQGSVNALNKQSSVIISGEMGTGKTLIGAAIPYIQKDGKSYRAIVMCPGHLIYKWEREIKELIPDVKVFHLESYKDVLALRKAEKKPESIEYYILSRDRGKLSYTEKPAVIWKPRRGWSCPTCGGIQRDLRNINNNFEIMGPEDFNNKNTKNSYCSEEIRVWNKTLKRWQVKRCNEYLWTADNSRIRRYSPAKLINKYLRGFFDYFIADEIHELKNMTKQGDSLGLISESVNKTIGLTGTLLGGYAKDLFYMLFRTQTQNMIDEGLSYNSINDWNARYGIVEEDFETEYYGMTNSQRKRRKVRSRIKPGVNPVVFGKHLINSVGFIELSDIQESLPDYTEYVELVSMDADQKEAYLDIQNVLSTSINNNRNYSFLRKHIHNLMVYPDKPFNWEPIIDEERELNYQPINLSETRIFPKEAKLIEILQEEKNNNRKAMVFATFTGKFGALERLKFILEHAGFKISVLTSSITSNKREAWINEKAKTSDVIICNARLVETGLDLIDFPTIIHYQTGYVLSTLRQSSRRSWRIGQTRPVKVYFLAYEETLQDTSLRLLGDRLEASMAIEGRFSEEGLQSLSDGLDMINELAKTLVEELNDIDSAETIWNRINSSNKNFKQTKVDNDYEMFLNKNISKEKVQTKNVQLSLLEFAKQNKIKKRKRRKSKSNANQLDLFSFIS